MTERVIIASLITLVPYVPPGPSIVSTAIDMSQRASALSLWHSGHLSTRPVQAPQVPARRPRMASQPSIHFSDWHWQLTRTARTRGHTDRFVTFDLDLWPLRSIPGELWSWPIHMWKVTVRGHWVQKIELRVDGRSWLLCSGDWKCRTWKMHDLENDGPNHRAGKWKT